MIKQLHVAPEPPPEFIGFVHEPVTPLRPQRLPNCFHVCSALIIRQWRLSDIRHKVAADLFMLGFHRAPFENPNNKRRRAAPLPGDWNR
jgi:hypothetical protein